MLLAVTSGLSKVHQNWQLPYNGRLVTARLPRYRQSVRN